MRVTRSMMLRDFIRRSQLSSERLNQLNLQLASGKRIMNPSDDPSGLARVHRYEETIARIQSYSSNAHSASAWVQTSQDSINHASSLVQEALNKAMIAASDTTTKEAGVGLARAIRGYIDEILSLVNRTQNGRHIFSGTLTDTKPFTELHREASLVGTAPDGVEAVTPASPFPDLPELGRAVYTVEITSDGQYATVCLKEADGSSVQIDDNGIDDTSAVSGYNHLANAVTVRLGSTLNTGRGLAIRTSSTMASGTQSFRVIYTPEGSYEYIGNADTVKAKVSDQVITDIGIPGHKLLQPDTVIGTRSIDPASGTLVPPGGGDIVFTVSDGTNLATVTLKEGLSYTQSDVLELLDQAGLFVGTGDQHQDSVYIQASFDSKGHLRLRPLSESVRAKIVLADISSGTNTLKSYFGLSSGETEGVSVLDSLNRLARNIMADVARPRIFPPSDWSGTSTAEVGRDGVYTGENDATWVFTVGQTGGLVGQTEGLTITVTDQATGAVIKEIALGDTYTSGEMVYVADGVSVSFSGQPGVLEAGDSFTLDLRRDRTETATLSTAVGHLVQKEADAGCTLQYIDLVQRKLDDYRTLLSQQLEQTQSISVPEAVAELEQEERAYQTALAVGARILTQVSLLDYL